MSSPDALETTRPRWWRSVRTRITAAVVLCAALAMFGAGVAAFVVETQRIDARILSAIDDELGEFRTLRTEGVDPRTGQPFAGVERLTRIALQRNTPDEREILIAWYDDQPQQPQGQGGRALVNDEEFGTQARRLIDDGGGTTQFDSVVGEILMSAQPVRDDQQTGALVVAHRVGAEQNEFLDTVRVYSVVSLLALVVVTGVAWTVAGRLLEPVRELRATAQEISDTDLSRRIPVEGNDDISDLVRTVNAMLDRLQQAFATQRTFLDDAGHELRTPVTILRGHLELLDPYDHGDVSSTRHLLLDETDRMSRLVDELIVLAKANRPDFLQAEPTDIGGLVRQVTDKVRATANRVWRLDESAAVTVEVDPQRITQALLQLTANAVRHTGEGDEIAFGSRLDAFGLRLWVRDQGPGVAPEDREHIFERFHRGADHQTSEGSGLGLSIVRAIAEAHGGTVHVESPPGQGATFVLTLPGRPVPVAVGPPEKEGQNA